MGAGLTMKIAGRWRRPAVVPVLVVGSCSVPLSIGLDTGSLFPPEASRPHERICEVGRRTAEGIECPAFRSEDGTLYTLIGPLLDDVPDDTPICLCLKRVETSFCAQGITAEVTAIETAERCRE